MKGWPQKEEEQQEEEFKCKAVYCNYLNMAGFPSSYIQASLAKLAIQLQVFKYHTITKLPYNSVHDYSVN